MSAGKSFLELCVELYNAHDLEAYMDLYADDAVQGMHDGTFEGRSTIHSRLARDLTAFPDAIYIVESFLEQGSTFADEWIFVGTHTGPFTLPDGTQLAATGKRVEIKGMEYVELRDGKIAVDNLYYDSLAIATQLGLLPEAVPATAS